MSYKPLPQERNVSRFDIRDGAFFARTGSAGLPAAFPAAGFEAIICGPNEVALIDEIAINQVTNDAATNATVTLRINGVSLPINFPGTVDLVRTERFVWRPRGNLVVQPGQSFTAKSSTGGVFFTSQMTVRYRKKRLVKAIADGDLVGRASFPNVATSGTIGAGSSQIIPGIAGMSVEILSMVYTGHSFNAAADNCRIGFWDGTTGSFAGAGPGEGRTIMRVWRQGANVRYAQPLIIGNTDGCIQGRSGYGVHVSATANLQAAPAAKGDWIICYRYIPASKLEVVSAEGTMGTVAAARGKFWVTCETPVTSATPNIQLDRFFGDDGSTPTRGPNALMKLKGWAYSGTTSADAFAGGLFPDLVGFGLRVNSSGTDVGATDAATTHIGLGEYIPLRSDDGAPSTVSILLGHDDTLLATNVNRIPAFAAYQSTATPTIVNRCHIAWGRFEAQHLQAQDVSGRSQFGLFA